MFADIKEKIKNNVSSEGFYTFYGNRKELAERYSKSLKRRPLESTLLERVKKIIPRLGGLSFEEFEFSIDILKERDRSPLERVEYASSLSGVSAGAMAHLLFLIDPRNYPPTNGLLKGLIETADDYEDWLAQTESLREWGVQNYEMLEAALCFKRAEKENHSLLRERISRANFTNLTELGELRSLLSLRDREEVKNLKRLRVTHPYVKSVLFARTCRAVVIDGSNIVFSMQGHPDLNRLETLFERIARSRVALFPFRIIFDGNIAYTIGGFQQDRLDRWLALPQVETYSPADERIIQLARQENAVVITYDRYLEYGVQGLSLLKPEEIDENLGL